MPFNRRVLLVGVLLSLAPAAALTLTPDGAAQVEGHAAGTFGTVLSGFSGGLAWGPDGTAYTHDGARVLYHWSVQTGRPSSRTVLTPPASLPGATDASEPELRLDGYRTAGRLTGPYIRVEGYNKNQSYQTAYTLTAGGRAVLGSVCQSTRERPVGCDEPGGRHRASVIEVRGGRATLELTGRSGPAFRMTLPAGRVLDVEPSPDGMRVAALRSAGKDDYDPKASLWLDVAWRGGVVSRQVSGPGTGRSDAPQVRWVDAQRLLTATPVRTPGTDDLGQRISLWGLSGPQPRWELEQGGLRDAVPSPDGQLFLTVRYGSVPEVRRVSDGSFVRALGAAVVLSVPMSGGRALVALDIGNGQVELRVVSRNGAQTRLGEQRPGSLYELAVSADGQLTAVIQEDSITVLDRDGRTLHRLRVTGRVQEVQFRGGGSRPRTLFARQSEARGSGGRGMSWDLATGRLLTPVLAARAIWPAEPVWLRGETRRQASGAVQSRLVALSATGEPWWQEGWRNEYAPVWKASPDGRAVVRAVAQLLPGPTEQQALSLYRLDPRTGQASPGLTLRPGDPQEIYRGLELLDFAPDRRHVLLGEGSGDGCGAIFYGLRLADLSARREVKLPAALSTGLRRFTGCGQPVPLPTASFTPENQMLVRDGNSLNWWRMTP